MPTFLFFGISKNSQEQMILAGFDFDENHLQV